MKRCHVLRLFVNVGGTLDKFGSRLDQLKGLFGDRPEYQDVRGIADGCMIALLEVGRGLDYMERRFRGETQSEAHAHVYIRRDREVPVARSGAEGVSAGTQTADGSEHPGPGGTLGE